MKVIFSKRYVNTLIRRKKLYKRDFDMDIFNSWLAEKVSVKAYCLFGDNENLLSIALMSKCDYDPLGLQANPMVINYIYTLPQERRKGYSSILLNHIKSKEEFTAFVSSPESEALFHKNGCLKISFLKGQGCVSNDCKGESMMHTNVYRWGNVHGQP